MTISGALTNAMSGLRAASRGAEVVSSNISNALTPGYARRVLALSTQATGGASGVQIDGVVRIMDAALASDRRMAEADQTHADSRVQFHTRFETLIGTPDDPASLSARIAGFENSLISAASRPDAPERLVASVGAARDLATGLRDASAGVQAARGDADRNIARMVDELNIALEHVVELNTQITALQVQGGNTATLQDQRQQVVDRIATLAPVREVPRDNGQIALYSTGGAVLIDGTAAVIGFEPVNVVTPHMSLADGTLSGLTVNGQSVRTDSDRGALRGGALAGQFAIRDEHGVAAQAQLDTLARDLIERFEDPAVDPTLGAGDAGLFTDGGAPLDPLDTVGLAQRLSVNSAVDPQQGGEAWRIRDGMNAVVQGNAGDATLLQAFSQALNDPRPVTGGGIGGQSFGAMSLAATLASNIGADRTNAEQILSFATSRLTELTERQLADGVDSDAEIQRLMLIERAYAANARVIETVDEMMQTLLRM
ncbi:Flagellar hook-associated protein 1 [Sulfitobacter sp. THAF37]|uniref:flagellar hook-associated protein FlgK n=1 Tax=Sulfitobacter sp. THAF37 TaxID=2587855 RepID=UPI00126786E6|nr:flagellar hook-associated protein FlgK [Sulfitobacter sp. THAF37]QFT58387.1 Flagellar hook-associated protein 1 [Sulfitobacter sp. THAF37]